MKTETKFFNSNDEEVDPSEGEYAVRLTFDDNDNLVKSEMFYVVEEGAA